MMHFIVNEKYPWLKDNIAYTAMKMSQHLMGFYLRIHLKVLKTIIKDSTANNTKFAIL